jgi:cytidine deaminase
MNEDLIEAATSARNNAHAPYSKFHVGAAIRTPSGAIFAGCNVENVAYPEGTCAEAGAIAAMCLAGEYEITDVVVVAGGDEPSSPCGGCRQKISEFAKGNVLVTMVAAGGSRKTITVADLLPGAFDLERLNAGVTDTGS